MMIRYQFLFLVATFLCTALPLDAQEDFVFTTIVDPETPVPEGVGTFSPVLPFRHIAVDRGEVVFIGRSIDRTGIYRYRQGNLERVVDTTMLFPGTMAKFSFFMSTAIDRGEIAFSAASSSVEGVFLHDGSFLLRIADHTDLIPGTANLFTDFGAVDLYRGELAFGGGDEHFPAIPQEAGLYATDGGLHTLFDQSDEIPPGGLGTFPAFETVAFDEHAVAFAMPRVDSSVDDGVYKDAGAGLEVVADLATPVPGGSGNFDGFRGMDYSAGVVAFTASGPGNQFGVYSDDGGLKVLVDTSTPVPGGGSFLSFGNAVGFSDGNVAFTAIATGGSGSFAIIDDELLEILRRGDPFDGRIIDRTFVYRGGMDRNAIAVEVRFSDDSSGIYLAELPLFTDGFESGDTSAWSSVHLVPDQDLK